jgi:DNA repair protein RecO (recombination protein O)
MLKKTKGIVLRRFSYGDNSKIAHIYTREFGKQSYLIFGGKSRKNKTDRLLQPMYVLDMQTYHKENRELHKIKEIGPEFSLKSIPFEFEKTAICQFLAELINKTQRDNESDELLFDFLQSTVELLDDSSEKTANFSPAFMVKYSKFLGLLPANNFSESQNTLDLQSGRFITGRPQHKNFLSGEAAYITNELTNLPFTDFSEISIKKTIRSQIITGFINYFNFHLNRPGKINSLEILTDVFS